MARADDVPTRSAPAQDFLLERKRLDDLLSSIQDGRRDDRALGSALTPPAVSPTAIPRAHPTPSAGSPRLAPSRRYQKQKYFMKRSGLRQCIYLLEGDAQDESNVRASAPAAKPCLLGME